MRKTTWILVWVALFLVLCTILGVICGLAAYRWSTKNQTQSEVDENPTQIVRCVRVECDKPHYDLFYQEIADTITQDEIDLVAKILYLEAGNQSMTGQRAVVEVIFNRVMSDKFPNTISDVIYQKNPTQFSTASRANEAKPTETQYQAIEETLNATEPILNKEVLFFSTKSNWRTTYEQIGDHYFCY